MSINRWSKENQKLETLVPSTEPKEYYSTEETLTNKVWIDGKPIYKKTWYANNVSLKSNTVIDSSFTSSSVDCVVNISSNLKGTDNNWMSFRDMVSGGTNYERFACLRTDGVVIYVSNYTIARYAITIEYTKTTD